uniref:Putative gland protein G19B10 n=1 Tax=Heterodera glycines TaxID=51029 RepID=Q86M74_HETGL|nr:putative gland protein G19B10 [Heterodera glycines]
MHLKIFLLILFVTICSVWSLSPKIHHNYHQQQQQHNIKNKLPPKNIGTKHLKTEINGHNKHKHNPASRHGHALLQKVKDQLNNDGWASEDANKTSVLLSSLLAIECHMKKLDKKRTNDSAEIKHLTEQICAAENKEQIGIHKLINEVAKTFEKDGKKMVEQMKRDEHTVKVHLDGHYGTLAEILPSAKKHAKATRLRTYHAVLHLLHLITPKMEEGPAKEAM